MSTLISDTCNKNGEKNPVFIGLDFYFLTEIKKNTNKFKVSFFQNENIF